MDIFPAFGTFWWWALLAVLVGLIAFFIWYRKRQV